MHLAGGPDPLARTSTAEIAPRLVPTTATAGDLARLADHSLEVFGMRYAEAIAGGALEVSSDVGNEHGVAGRNVPRRIRKVLRSPRRPNVLFAQVAARTEGTLAWLLTGSLFRIYGARPVLSVPSAWSGTWASILRS
jgi:hypothetical protein